MSCQGAPPDDDDDDDVSALVVNLRAKFEVSISHHARDIEGVPKFQK